MKMIDRFRDGMGQGLVEYGLILALVSVVAVSAIGGVGDKVSDTFGAIYSASDGGGIYSEDEIQEKIDAGYTSVASAEELRAIKNNLSGKYIQISDIDLSGINNWEPLGNDVNNFTGEFDGGGYTISDLKVDRKLSDNVGLFGYTSDAEIKNVGLIDAKVEGRGHVGGLVGNFVRSSIDNSYVTGEVSGSTYRVGGLVGFHITRSSIKNSHTDVLVSGNVYNMGGLVGGQYSSSSVINSYAVGDVIGSYDQVGGLVGYQENYSRIENSFATGDVVGKARVGGLVGFQQIHSTVRNSYTIGNASGEGSIGGVVGAQVENSLIINIYAIGEVIGYGENIGGILGLNQDSHIANSAWVNDEYGKGIGTSDNGTEDNVRGLSKSEVEHLIQSIK